MMFSPDGRRLISGSADTSALVWDVAGRLETGRPRTIFLSPPEVERLWATLASEDATAAYQAIWELVAAPRQSVAFIKERLRPVPAVDSVRVTALIKDLDSDRFAVRAQAARELVQLAEGAEPAMRKALTASPTVEVRTRLEQVLEKLAALTPSQLQTLRALRVLEYIGTPPAQEVLELIAKGATGARLTREAQASLQRLAQRNVGTP